MSAMHEFWLPDYPISCRSRDVYRVILGDVIRATDRKTFKPGWKGPDIHTDSGSIGFMDLTAREQLVPKENALPYPNPNNSPFLENNILGAIANKKIR
jgi:hypothetical protein